MTLGFGESSSKSSKRALVAKETEVSSPDIEGPITLIAPELPEDTLMDVSHKHLSGQICHSLAFIARSF